MVKNIAKKDKCIQIAIENPPKKGEKVKIFNQATESHTLKDLAKLIADITGAEIRFYKNPRNEDESNELIFSHEAFIRLGLNPITLKEGLLKEVIQIAQKYSFRCDLNKIHCVSLWTKEREIDKKGKHN